MFSHVILFFANHYLTNIWNNNQEGTIVGTSVLVM